MTQYIADTQNLMKYKDLTELLELSNRLETEKLIKFGQEGLKLLNLKIGDKVLAYFNTSYTKNGQAYTSGDNYDAIIKQHDNGIIYLESVEKLSNTYNKCNGFSGRSRRSWWETEHIHMKTTLNYIKIPVNE